MGVPLPSLVVARACSDADVALACDVLIEAADWLGALGQPLWSRGSLTPEKIRLSPDKGSIYLARASGRAIGTFRLQFEDSLFWPEALPGEALYLHKLAVRRSAAGTGISRKLLEYAAAETRAANRAFLRLACAIRPKLCALYESAGFWHHSDRTAGEFAVRRYERAVAIKR